MDPPSPQQGSGPDRRAARQTAVLKAAVFATGFCGIVAEYAMATLASYMMGEAVLQWTLVLSLMLFTMGVGSRVSRWVEGHLADTFVAAELVLSLLVAASAPVAYLLSAWIEPIGLVIYPMAGGVGFLIGLEIPLATRLNERFEELRLNVASMFEKDYYGALAGGLVFAFVALPHLGLTLTPVALGMVNFAVAAALAWVFWPLLVYRRAVAAGLLGVAAALVALAVAAEPVVQFGEQRKYRDRVVHHEQSRFQRIVLTRWKDHHWLYLDGNQQFSSFDEERYHEPLVHPALAVAPSRRRVLILGGGDGLAAREVLRYDDVESVVLVDLDPAMTDLGRTHPVLTELNEGAFEDPRLTVENRDANGYLESTETAFDVILVDLPDPKTVSLARLYSRPFYTLAARRLVPGGVLVTQATSPFFSRDAFLTILATVRAADFVAVPYHAHVPTLGEWGWVLGVKSAARGPSAEDDVPASQRADALRGRLEALEVEVPTRFLDREAMVGMLAFGKGDLDGLDTMEVSELSNLSVYYRYREGAWDFY